MNPEEKAHFEDLIIKAVQSGKRETSDLVDTILHRIEPAIEKSVEKYVNGKIKALDTKFDAYVIKDTEDKMKQIETLKSWKEDIDPVIKMGKDAQVAGAVSMGLLKAITTFGVACGLVYAFFKWIK